jgi:hypothetical protein
MIHVNECEKKKAFQRRESFLLCVFFFIHTIKMAPYPNAPMMT